MSSHVARDTTLIPDPCSVKIGQHSILTATLSKNDIKYNVVTCRSRHDAYFRSFSAKIGQDSMQHLATMTSSIMSSHVAQDTALIPDPVSK